MRGFCAHGACILSQCAYGLSVSSRSALIVSSQPFYRLRNSGRQSAATITSAKLTSVGPPSAPIICFASLAAPEIAVDNSYTAAITGDQDRRRAAIANLAFQLRAGASDGGDFIGEITEPWR